jgi:hypothetical protein
VGRIGFDDIDLAQIADDLILQFRREGGVLEGFT